MRSVTYAGICDEVGESEYASNATTAFITGAPYTGLLQDNQDIEFTIGANVVSLLQSKNLHQFPDQQAGQKSAFEHTYGMKFFERIARIPHMGKTFDEYMAIRRGPEMPQWFDIFPAADALKESPEASSETVLLVDVGGGIGHEVRKFKGRYPKLVGRMMVQDQRVEDGIEDGVEFMKHDFFGPQPMKGARFYYMRNVMHDWPDDECRRLLSLVVAVMDKTHSRILIDDLVLPNVGTDGVEAASDIVMMLFVSGIERTLRQWVKLLTSVGLELVKVWSVETSAESIVEARVKS